MSEHLLSPPASDISVSSSSGRLTAQEKLQQVKSLAEQFGLVVITSPADLEKCVLPKYFGSLKPGAAYVRYSSKMQKDSFSLEAQLRRIIENAQQEGVEIVMAFADLAQSAYHKKHRPAITAALAAARQRCFRILYIHKVDRLARRLEWFLEIVCELQAHDVELKAADQSFDLNTPEGKLIGRLLSLLAEFYSENLAKETGKGKLEASLEGYHNGKKPWGYISVQQGKHKVGVPDPKLVAIVIELFERYASGLYSDFQLSEWLNSLGHCTDKGNPFNKDSVREMLQNPYYAGKVRYKGMSVRTKGVCYRSTPAKLSEGKHEPIISPELWERCQAMRARRTRTPKTRQQTSRIYLLQNVAVCAQCGRRLRAQSKKKFSYYREYSRERGYTDCPHSSMGARAAALDDQIAAVIQAIELPANWQQAVREIVKRQSNDTDPEVERREIRATLRLMRENYERKLYDGEEFQYWQKVSALQERLELLKRVPENAINQAAETLLNLRESWDWATSEERRDLVRMMILEVGCNMAQKRIVWIKPQPGFDLLFRILPALTRDDLQRYWLNEGA